MKVKTACIPILSIELLQHEGELSTYTAALRKHFAENGMAYYALNAKFSASKNSARKSYEHEVWLLHKQIHPAPYKKSTIETILKKSSRGRFKFFMHEESKEWKHCETFWDEYTRAKIKAKEARGALRNLGE